jgi:ribonuclease E
MSKEMLVNVAEEEECRIAIVEKGKLEELYVERMGLNSHVGNIYKGKVVNVESSIQAAFIDFGIGKNGFLHISDLHPRYCAGAPKDCIENIGKRKALKDRPPIQKSLRKGDELIVQVTKEGVNTKGPTLSTYIAIPGKYLVMMPYMKKFGISHKIEDDAERERLRAVIEGTKRPRSLGFIVRTAGQGSSKRDISKDLHYLCRLWKNIEQKVKSKKTPSELYKESDLVIRTLRDVFNSDIKKIVCDSESVTKSMKEFLAVATPRYKNMPVFYDGSVPLFHNYKIEEEIAKVQSRTVELEAGGSIVIEQTEALVAIDVNSGRYRKQQAAEQTAYKINLEAADEIARQLRLRDLGGLIVCDFIDMTTDKHRRDVEREFRDATKPDRAKSKILRISRFGVVEMTRQRMRPSLQLSTYLTCPHCAGRGFVKSHEALAIEIIRLLNLSASKSKIKRIEISVSPEVGEYLQNNKRGVLSGLEQSSNTRITIHALAEFAGEKRSMVCYDDRGSVVKV